MKDLRVERAGADEIFTLRRPDRLSSSLVVVAVLGFPAVIGSLRARSLLESFLAVFASPFLIVAVLAGIFVFWRWSRNDVIRVTDRTIILDRRLGTGSLDVPLEIDRCKLTEVVVRETATKARGQTYANRTMIFLDGDLEYARTLPLSVETARHLARVATDWPRGRIGAPVLDESRPARCGRKTDGVTDK